MSTEAAKILAVIGPTACGKTRRGVELAQALNGEIISADSRQIYRGMDVGTGKDLAEYGSVPHHLIDIAPAGYKYNLFEFLRDARSAVADINARGRQPIVVGGTGMYVEALLKGTDLPQVPENPALRASLDGKSMDELASILASYKTLHNHNDLDTTKRAIRAIEIEEYYSRHPEAAAAAKAPQALPHALIGLDISREDRRSRISDRLHRRFEQEDMLGEVRTLLDSGINPDDLIYYGLEYKYLTLHLIGQLSRKEMEEQLEIAIHQFAKRQMTWFRGMERRGFTIHWLPYNVPSEELIETAKRLLADA